MRGVRRRKESNEASLSVLSGYGDSAYPLERAKMNFVKKKLRQPPRTGAVLEADGRNWYNDNRDHQVTPILNHKGQNTLYGSVFLVPSLTEEDRHNISPSDLWGCPFCYGTGTSLIFSPEMAAKLNGVEFKDQTQPPMICSFCNGRGIPPIPYGDLNGNKKQS